MSNEFEREVVARIIENSNDKTLLKAGNEFLFASINSKYSYNFAWMGRPIIQYPQDIVAMQELVWSIKPDLIIETGIAHGGSLILSASLLAMLDYTDAVESGVMLDPKSNRRRVLGIDIDIRKHNHEAINAHPLAHKIKLIQGSSIASEVIAKVKKYAEGFERVLVCLDSNHTHDHVLAELNAYASLVSIGSYCVVFDTIIEDLPDSLVMERPWRKGNSPKSAVWEYLKKHPEYQIDQNIENKLLITVAPHGYLKRVK